MKRSDMIHSIASELLLSWLDLKGLEALPDFKEAQQIADLLLQRIEKEGMFPPEYTCINVIDPKPSRYGQCRMIAWEPEND